MRRILKYVCSGLLVALATVPGLLLLRFSGVGSTTLLLLAIVGSFWYLGRGPGWFAVALSNVAKWYVFTPKYFSWSVSPHYVPKLMFFATVTGLLAVFVHGRRRAEGELRELVGALETEVDAAVEEKRAREESSTRHRIRAQSMEKRFEGLEVEIAESRAGFSTLSDREREVFWMVVDGLLNKQIAAKLEIAEVTVKLHRKNLMRKMRAESLAELVRKGERLRLKPDALPL